MAGPRGGCFVSARGSLPDSWTLELNGPGMGSMHRAGLGGLAATLLSLRQKDAPEGARWAVGGTMITLEAPGALDELVAWVVEEGLAIGDDGLIAFPGLGSPQPGTRYALQQALLGTFLQHGRSRKLEKSERQLVLDPDGESLPDSYRPMSSFKHQGVTEEVVEALRTGTTVRITGFFLPGAAEKHPGRTWSRMEVDPHQYLALAFAPVGCLVFIVRSRAAGIRERYALVIPEVTDLRAYADLRRKVAGLSPLALTVASPADAALQLSLLDDHGVSHARREGHRFCSVVALGKQPWAKQQMTRTKVLEVAPPDEVTRFNYRLVAEGIMEFQADRRVQKDGPGTWVATSAARGAIAEALAGNQSWWTALTETYRRNSEFRKAVHYARERRGLAKMVEKAKWEREDEKLFVEACHAAMRALYGSIGGRTTAAGTDFSLKAATEMTKIRSSLLRAKNADSFRDVLLDFWARASRSKVRSNPVLRRTPPGEQVPVWERILPLLDDEHWRKGRDLALLALISYSGSDEEEELVAEAESLESA